MKITNKSVVTGIVAAALVIIIGVSLHKKTTPPPAASTSTLLPTQVSASSTPSAMNTPTNAPTPSPTSVPFAIKSGWKPVTLVDFPGNTLIQEELVQPDANSNATVLEMDMSQLQLNEVGGTQEPGGSLGVKGTGVIPADAQSSGNLVAAFDGGFQYRDGQYGMILAGVTYVPLKNNLATLVSSTDGSLKIINYAGQDLSTNVAFVRQNAQMLVNNGVISIANENDKTIWGRTDTADIHTWRTGIGITANGNLLFATGNPITPTLLAETLKNAGAINAMQLDINPFWVRFTLFDKFKNGAYTPSIIMPKMYNGYHEFLTGYTKDYFYVTKK